MVSRYSPFLILPVYIVTFILGCSPKMAEQGKAARQYNELLRANTVELSLARPSDQKLEGKLKVRAVLLDQLLQMAELEKKREAGVVFGENYNTEKQKILKEAGEYLVYRILVDRISKDHPHPADDINKAHLEVWLVNKHDIRQNMAMQQDEKPTEKINSPEIAGDRTDYYSHTEIVVKFTQQEDLKQGYKLIVKTKFGEYEASR